ncbi:Protein melted [Armadillidium nasatum]|uniref:Protein melted n=1 Tax=Armadillidium nasatum TaxID=96803 RepID=A0A5N5SVB7_9CRUS|nr:Protein melted [Armadillidium nasatum]
MHEIFTQVLTHKDLPKAGDLFNIPDEVIVNDLTDVIGKITEIAGLPEYTRNDNDQSVVEICITRVTSAIRETESIEQHAEALVALLQTCLNHNLRPTPRGQDPPHAKIASDVLSCIFLNYNKRSVMALALPVAVKFLHKGNRELSRNMSSYLSLSAIEAADLLARHVQPIIDSVISGNYCLSRVLLQIYAVEKESVHGHVMTLVSLLPQCDTNDKLGLLTLFSLVAKNKPALVDCLSVNSTSLATLQIFVELCAWHPAPFTEHIVKFKTVIEQQPHCLSPSLVVIASIGRLSKERAKSALEYIAQQLPKVETNQLANVLKEVQSLCSQYPALLTENLLTAVNKCSDRANTSAREYVQQLNNEYNEIRNTNVNHTPGGVTIVRVGGTTIGGGGRNDGVAASRSEVNIGGGPHRDGGGLFQPNTTAGIVSKFGNKYQKHNDTSRSTSRLVTATNRSMPRLNALPQSAGRLGSSSIQLNKSLTRLNSSHALPMNRSITVLSQPTRHFSGHIPPPSSIVGSYIGGSQFGGSRLVGSTLSPLQPAIATTPAPFSFPSSHIPVSSSATLPATQGLIQTSSTITTSTLPLSSLRTSRPNSTNIGSFISPDQQNNTNSAAQRISVFEPYAMRDTVQHFCEKHLDKIKAYMQKILVKLPLPVRCGIEERKNKKHAKLYFACQGKGEHCLYSKQFFSMKTRNPRIWIHLMFLALQVGPRSGVALSTRETQVSSLKNCWDILKCDNKTFITLVTSAFPSTKDLDLLMHELRNVRFFDVFEYNGVEQQWGCFLCNHPDRARGFVEENTPVMEGQLKEKKSKWKIFRKWRTRYFTLSGGHLSYRGEEDKIDEKGGIEVHQIRSVKVGRGRQIPKAFEIFTDNTSLVLKAKDSSNAEEWVRCLSIAVAHSQAKEDDHNHHTQNQQRTTTSIPRNFLYGHHSTQSFPASQISGSKTHV